MRWLVIQSDGMHKGQDGWTRNDHLRECFAIKHALQLNCQEVDIWGLRHGNYSKIPDFSSYDVIFNLEQYEMDWLPDLSSYKALKIQWIIDLHCHRLPYERVTRHSDIILHSTRSLINDYADKFKSKKHIWFPNGVDSRFFDASFYEGKFPKKNDFVFVGSRNPLREGILRSLENASKLKVCFATGSDMIKEILEAKIHFNKNMSIDLNYRHFETIGLGTCLITDHQPDLIELGFKDGENCLTYQSLEECKTKVEMALASGKWLEIGQNGYNLSKTHTYEKRISSLLREIGV